MQKTEYVDITPHRSVFLKLGQAGYNLGEALAELIDNSIDASIPDKKLIVKIMISKTRIQVDDNGKGMPKSVASQLLRLGYTTKDNEKKLGKFGLGLKTSCLSLGSHFEVKTAQKNEEYSIIFDEERWTNEGDWQKFPLHINLSRKESHTSITITKLLINIEKNDVEKVINDINSRFGPFIESDSVEIVVNNKECKAKPPQLTSEGKKAFTLKLLDGNTIKGWFGFKLAGGVKEWYGFNTFRQGRLITVHDKIGLSRDPKARQIVGEIYMDHVPVSHNKRQDRKSVV